MAEQDPFLARLRNVSRYEPPAPASEEEDSFFSRLRNIRKYTIFAPPPSAPKEEDDPFLSRLKNVSEVPTATGYARESAKEVVKGAGQAAVASPLKAIGTLQQANEVKSNETLLYPMVRGVADKLKDPKTRDEAISELEGYRDSWVYGLEKEQKAALDGAIRRAREGESDPNKLLEPFESVKPASFSERAAYKAGAKVEKVLDETLGRRKGYEDSVGLDVAGAIGSTVGSVAQGVVLGGVPGLLAASALQGVDEQRDRAKAAGLSDEEAAVYAVKGAGPGAVGMLSVEFILRKVPPIARKKMLQVAGDMFKSGAAEAVTEAVQQMMQNAIEMEYNPKRGLMDGTIYDGVLGGAAGMGVRGAVLMVTRGKGARGAGTGEVEAADPGEKVKQEFEAKQAELAAKELLQREREKAGTGPGSTPEPHPKTPAEAAQSGKTNVAGEPVTITPAVGESFHATVTERFPDGGFRVVDKDGVVTEISAKDLQPDPETNRPLISKKDGWERILTDEDLEKNLAEYLSIEGQWRKVTVELDDGTIFKGIEGLRDPEGGRIFRDGLGTMRGYSPAAVRDVSDGWEPGVPPSPDPILGERQKERGRSAEVSEGTKNSPIQTDVIRQGQEVIADTVGAGKANTILETAGLPKVDTPISYKDDDGTVLVGTIHDATDGHVQVLTDQGELISQPIKKALDRIIELPEFMGKQGKQAGDNQEDRRQGATGIQLGQGLGDQAQYQGREAEAAYPGVRDQEGKGEASQEVEPTPEVYFTDVFKGTVFQMPEITKDRLWSDYQGKTETIEPVVLWMRDHQQGLSKEEFLETFLKNDRRASAARRGIQQDERQAQVRKEIEKTIQTQAAPESARPGRERGDVERAPAPQGRKQEDAVEGAPPPPVAAEAPPQPTQPTPVADQIQGQVAKPATTPEATERDREHKIVGGWWDAAPHDTRRKEITKAGFTNPDQRVSYVSSDWKDLPQGVKDLVVNQRPVGKNRPDYPIASTLTGISVPVRYEVRDADALVTSIDEEARINPAYPQELQPRDRKRLTSRAQINKIAADIKPDWLDQSPKASDGAPIVSPDGVVESGNGRVVALRKAYREGKAENYRGYLERQGYDTTNIKTPVLVRVRQNEMSQADRVRFTMDANEPDQLAMSPTEQAIADSSRMPDDMLDLYRGGEIDSTENQSFVRDFMKRIVPVAAQSRMVTGDNKMSQEAVRRVENALFYKAYGDSDLLQVLVESPDPEIKSIGNVLRKQAASWSKMRSMAADGRIDPTMDQTDKLMEAVKIVRRARIEARPVSEFVGQKDIFTGKALDPTSEAFLRLMFRNTDDWTRPTGMLRIGEALDEYIAEATKTKPAADLEGKRTRTPEDILAQAKAKITPQEQAGLFDRPRPESQPKAEATVETKPVPEPGAIPEGVVVKKNGQPWSSKEDAMRVVMDDEWEPVKVPGGWGRQRIGEAEAKPEPRPEPKAKPQSKPEARKEPEPEAKPAKPAFPEGVVVKKDGTPFATANAAMLQARGRAKKDGGEYESVPVDGGFGYRKVGKARAEVKKATEPNAVDDIEPEIKEEKANVASPSFIEGWSTADTSTEEIIWTPELREKQKVLSKEMREYLDRIGLKDVASSVDLEVLFGKDQRVGGKFTIRRFDDGSIKSLIQASLTLGKPTEVMRHESIHALRNLKLFTDKEWGLLERAVEANKDLMAEIDWRYQNLGREGKLEEGVAELFARHQPSDKGFVARLLDRIKSFLEALGNVLRGNGFKSVNSVFSSIEKGEVGGRQRTLLSELERAERNADQAIKDLKSQASGIISEEKFASVPRHDEYFVRDMGLFKKFFVTPRTIAAFSSSFAKVYDVAKRQFATRDMTIADLGRRYEPYRNLSRESRSRVDKVLELGRLEQRVYRPAANGSLSVTASMDSGLMKQGQTVTLSADEVAAYKSVRGMLDAALDQFRDQTITDFGLDPTQVNTVRQVLQLATNTPQRGQAKKLRTLAKLMYDIEQSKRTGYVPFSRFGNVVVVAEMVDPATGKATTLHSETVEVRGIEGWIGKRLAKNRIASHAEVARIMGEYARKYPGARIRHFQVASQDDQRNIRDRDMLAELTQLHGADLENAVAAMHGEALSKGFRRHFLGAKNTPGYSLDLSRSIADYVITFSGFKARRQHAKEWDSAIREIPGNRPRELSYADNYRQYVNNPAEEFARTRQAGFIMLLGGNLSNALSNMTQVPLIAAPYMSMFSNSGRVELELARAYKDVTKMFGGGLNEVFNPDKAPLDVRQALKRAWDEGEFTPLAMHDIMGTAYNTKESSRKISAALKATTDIIALPQTSTERANRLVTFMAAYRIAKADPNFELKAKRILGNHDLAQEVVFKNYSPDNFAKFIVDETQYDVGKVNRATIMRNAGAAIFQFKPFITQTLELHAKTFSLHKGGARAWGLMMAGLIGSAGLWALPGSDDAAYAFEKIYGWWRGVDIDLKAELREQIHEFTSSPFAAEVAGSLGMGIAWEKISPFAPELITQGPTRMLGIDVTNRIGLGKIVPRTMEEAAGVPLTLYWDRVVSAIGHAKEGKPLQAAMEALPLFLQNPAKAQMWKTEGVRTERGDPVMTPEELTGFDIAAKSAGFNPRTVAERRELEWSQQRAGKAVQEKKARIYRTLAKTFVEAGEAANRGDREGFLKNVEKYKATKMEVMEWNKKVIAKKDYHLVIVLDEGALDRKKKEEILGRGPVREARAPKVSRPRQQELRSIYGAPPR